MPDWPSGDIHANGIRLHYTRTGGRARLPRRPALIGVLYTVANRRGSARRLTKTNVSAFLHPSSFSLHPCFFQVGAFHAFGFPEYLYVDTLDAIDAATPAEALANDAAVPVTPEMQAIYDECAVYLDRTRERYVLWFRPIVHGSEAEQPFSLAG